MFRIRRISTKLLWAVLAAVVVPFIGFAIFVDTQIAQRTTRQALYSLQGLSLDLAARIDAELDSSNRDIALWTGLPAVEKALAEQSMEGQLMRKRSPEEWGRDLADRDIGEPLRDANQRAELVDFFNSSVALSKTYDLVMLVDRAGNLVAVNTYSPTSNDLSSVGPGAESGAGPGSDSGGSELVALGPEVLTSLYERDYSEYEWFQRCSLGDSVNVGRQVTDLMPVWNESPGVHPENYHMGFGGPIWLPGTDEVVGVLFALVNWRHVDVHVGEPLLIEIFKGLVREGKDVSAYAWVWEADADTILAHPSKALYDKRVSGPAVGLPQLMEAARGSEQGLYPEYEFDGVRKSAAFHRCRGPNEGGFGWVVGVGINNEDLYSTVNELRSLLFRATALVVLLALLWTTVIARRATQPILGLRAYANRVAGGDLETQMPVSGEDELAELVRDFNRMTSDLKLSREQLVSAEKDAAWKEMAQQVAHDIKNPLTPIRLSVDLMCRAQREDHEDFESIFLRTTDTIRRQVHHLREISADFQALTGTSSAKLEVFALDSVLEEVLELNAAWAQELDVEVQCELKAGQVLADRSLLRRVFINIISNALQAMPNGGQLRVRSSVVGECIALEVEDTGVGLSDTVRQHLFEPHFTTKSHGTGLGLAIARRVLEELNGKISLGSARYADGSSGTRCHIQIPAHVANADDLPDQLDQPGQPDQGGGQAGGQGGDQAGDSASS